MGNISNDILRINECRKRVLLSGARVLPRRLDEFNQLAQDSALEFELYAVYSRLECRLKVPHAPVFQDKKGDIHGDDDQVDYEELVQNARTAGVFLRPQPKELRRFPDID